MTYEQIYQLVNACQQQLWGSQAIATNDLSGLISLGDKVFASNTDRDGFLNVLADRINATIIRTLDNRVEFPTFIRNEIEYGAIVSKINVQVLPAQEAQSYNVGNVGFTPTNFKIDKPVVSQLLFGDPRLVWEFDLTVPDQLYKTAFTSESEMGAFITGLMDAMDKSLIESINAMNHAALCNLIAEKFKANHNIIHVLTDYNTLTSQTLTADQFLHDAGALRYLSEQIDRYMEYMSQTNVLYNEGINNNPMERATQRDNMRVIMASDVAAAARFNLYSQDYNYNFEQLPYYDSFVSLQGSGTTQTPQNNMSIDVIPSSEAGQLSPTAVQEDYIACVLCDREAIGTTWRDMFTATDRNNRNRYTNFTAGAGLSWFNDLSEQVCVFQID